MAKTKNPHAVISLAEAERAIYIDCEGFKDKSPTLIGVLMDGTIEQIVFDPDLELAATRKGLRISTFGAEARRIYELCLQEQRVIVAYSEHELRLFADYADIDIGTHYRNARRIAKRWKNQVRPGDQIGGRGLKDFLRFIGYPMGGYLGEKPPTERINGIRDMLCKHGSYGALTPRKKKDWTKLLEYNRVDCEGMRTLVILASRGLAHEPPAAPQ